MYRVKASQEIKTFKPALCNSSRKVMSDMLTFKIKVQLLKRYLSDHILKLLLKNLYLS